MKKRSAKIDIMTVTNAQDTSGRPETLALLSDIRSLIEAARMRVSTAANVEMVLLYWHIGERIRKDILGMERADYGKQIVQTLSGKLISEYGRGYNMTPNIKCSFCGSKNVEIYSKKRNNTTAFYYYRCDECRHYRLYEKKVDSSDDECVKITASV